ncbi:MAG: DNA translocase FtsK 4TM domain-containing protein [Muribaculaceae bacterium]
MSSEVENESFNPDIRNVPLQGAGFDVKNKKDDSKPKGTIDKIKAMLMLRRTKWTVGVIIGFLGVFLLLSFISFFMSGAADQSEVINTSVTSQNVENINNNGAIFGAYVSHLFIEQGVGLAAFIIVIWCFIIAFRLLKGVKVFFVQYTFLSLLSVFAFSMIAGALTYGIDITFYPIGGNIGYYLNTLLIDYTSIYGMIMVNFVVAMVWVFVFYRTLKTIYEYTAGIIKRSRRLRRVTPAGETVQTDVPLSDFMGDRNLNKTPVKEPIVETPVRNNEIAPQMQEPADKVNLNVKPSEPKVEQPTDFVIKQASEIEKSDNVSNDDVYDPTKELSKFKLPSIELLKNYGNTKVSVDVREQEENKELITRTLLNYGIEINSIEVTVGPTITLFEIVPKEGVRIQRIKSLEDDIALSLAAKGIRIIAPVPGKGTVGIEVPNREPQIVSMRSVIESRAFQESKAALPIALGCTVSNEVVVADLAKTPHLLVAGATGQGKSVGLNAIITSLLYKKHPAELKFVLVDPKMVEFSLYALLEHHYLAKLPEEDKAVITDAKKVVPTLNSLVTEMEDRYRLLEKAGERNVKDYNARFVKHQLNPNNGHRFMPYIVLIIDEFCDLIMQSGKEVETPLVRLAQKARAIGIHVILATQRPDAKTITGLIKANFPSRVAFRVGQMQDSRTIIDCSGAQHLIGKGDMLFSADGDIVRVQCAFVDTPEVKSICEFVSSQIGFEQAYHLPEPINPDDDGSVSEGGKGGQFERDSLFEEALEFIASSDYASTSSLQRRFGIGYNRAGRIMDQMEAAGIVGASQGGRPRKVLMTPSEIDMYLGK